MPPAIAWVDEVAPNEAISVCGAKMGRLAELLRAGVSLPKGFTVTVDVECTEVVGKKISFNVKAHDGVDQIGAGRHERFVVAWDRFNASVAAKAAKVVERV